MAKKEEITLSKIQLEVGTLDGKNWYEKKCKIITMLETFRKTHTSFHIKGKK